MKKLSVILFLLFINTGFVFCQGNSTIIPDKKLLSRHTQTELDKLVSEAPSVIEYENFIVNNSYFIRDAKSGENTTSYGELHFFNSFTKEIIVKTIMASDLIVFNIYDYDFAISKIRNYYVIGNTGKILVVYSQPEITEKYNKSRGF
jgi:hypothetical protein